VRTPLTALTALTFLFACRRPSADAGLMALQHRGDTLWLIPAPGVRISAGYAPRLLLESGPEIRFDSPRVSPDSLWFTEPPVAVAPQPAAGLAGTLKASTCDNDAGYCRLVILTVENGQVR
jgi:hypothetical protein